MNQEYYIVTGKIRKGPYDTVTLVRKIRNGTLTAQSYLQQDEATAPKPAKDWAELAEFFNEKKEERPATAVELGVMQKKKLGDVLQSGIRFLQRNLNTTVFSGLFVLFFLLLATVINFGMPHAVQTIAYMICFVLGHFTLSCYMLSVLRMARGQPVDATYMESKILPVMKSLLLSSLFVSTPAIIGLALLTSGLPKAVLGFGLLIFTVPGLFALALYSFTPLLILDKGMDVWDSMETSRKAVLKSGMENAGVIYALYVINFLAGLCILIPMAITMPITTGALTEIYDEMFG
jgi:uncharacterized membrane protein